MTSCAWLWLYAGAFLMLLELFAPGFVIFFFGLAAAAVGLMRFAFGEAFDATWQIASFSVFSVLFLALLFEALLALTIRPYTDSIVVITPFLGIK